MAREIFRAISNLRLVLDTETDADSPTTETTMAALREMIEMLYQVLLAAAAAGTFTADPSNDSNGYAYDSAAGWTDDQHNGRTLLILSGTAKGNFYTIDDTTGGATDRIDCTGDNLYGAGVRSGDDYIILYDIKANTDGHDHDGVNSKRVEGLALGAVEPEECADGTLQLFATGTEAAIKETTSTSYVDAVDLAVYVPTGATKIQVAAKIGVANATATATVDFVVAAGTSDEGQSNSTAGEWVYMVLDVSALSGWQSLVIELKTSNGSYAAKLFAASAIWKA